MPKIVKKFPVSENGSGVHCITTSGQEYFITQCKEKMRFTLWKKLMKDMNKLQRQNLLLIWKRKCRGINKWLRSSVA